VLFWLVAVLLCVDEHPAVSMLVMPFCCLELTHQALSIMQRIWQLEIPSRCPWTVPRGAGQCR
jgi:hypothetical protein